ncbi:ribosomal protein L7Ae/L30e/S12e/Gadd45 family protein [Artemisia annua]|uniref:Ribosomal protein L7Ae/L30e/S12e/Gadd45 family protein n=1 Tax=Artemisia annua TaxID=35608 RepID=A0A2U1MAS6_ARTAN|nr:ribosomal protein L7Ae/L30e/S12e/Gadd45 family protein [Artemisia annua]
MAPKKGVKIATKKKTEKVVNPLFEKRQEQFDISWSFATEEGCPQICEMATSCEDSEEEEDPKQLISL